MTAAVAFWICRAGTAYNPKLVSDFNSLKWTDLYTLDRVAELGKWTL